MRRSVAREMDPWAEYYDILHRGLPGEAHFYVMAAVLQSRPVLEIGCGTGRVCIPMAMSGADVTGMDISPAMLALCRDKARQLRPFKGKLSLLRGDMRRFRLDRRFGLVAMPYRALMHCLTPEEQLACLECVRAHLEPGGEALLNLWAARPRDLAAFPPGKSVHEKPVLMATHDIPGETTRLRHYYDAWRDDHLQLIHERHRLDEVGPRGKILHRQPLSLTRAWITPREMSHLAARAGFDVVEWTGDFDGSPFDGRSTEMILRLRTA